MREPLRLVCEYVGACVLGVMGLSLLWFAGALLLATVRDLVDRRRRYVPSRWVEHERRRRLGDHRPSMGERRP